MVEKMALESNPENPEAAIADIAVGVPMKRLAKPIEVGELFAFLGSDESSYLTGSQIVIDGGQHITRDHVYRYKLNFVKTESTQYRKDCCFYSGSLFLS